MGIEYLKASVPTIVVCVPNRWLSIHIASRFVRENVRVVLGLNNSCGVFGLSRDLSMIAPMVPFWCRSSHSLAGDANGDFWVPGRGK